MSGFSNTTFWLVFAVLGMGTCVGAYPDNAYHQFVNLRRPDRKGDQLGNTHHGRRLFSDHPHIRNCWPDGNIYNSSTSPLFFRVNPSPVYPVNGTAGHYHLGADELISSHSLLISILMVAGPAAEVNPVLGAIMLVMFALQFFFWITPPTFAIAMRDNVGNLKDWIISVSRTI